MGKDRLKVAGLILLISLPYLTFGAGTTWNIPIDYIGATQGPPTSLKSYSTADEDNTFFQTNLDKSGPHSLGGQLLSAKLGILGGQHVLQLSNINTSYTNYAIAPVDLEWTLYVSSSYAGTTGTSSCVWKATNGVKLTKNSVIKAVFSWDDAGSNPSCVLSFVNQ